MKPIAVVLGAILVGVVLLSASAKPQTADEKAPLPTDRAQALQLRLDEECAAREVLEQRLERLEKQMAAVLEWTAGLERASGVLSSAADQARQHGFEYAAPNPRARTDIIEGLRGFASALLENRPPARAPKKTEPPGTAATGSESERQESDQS